MSVVISTYQRPDACERALVSVLEQTVRPREILVCDDGSQDATPERFEAWAAREPLVRYLRMPSNAGWPAPSRNLGVERAGGAWLAFLDDDDRWLPQKLARQACWFEDADVIATNAVRSGGEPYFPGAPEVLRPSRRDVLHANPVILSSLVARRELVQQAGGFIADRWARGVEDYGLVLALADLGASMVVLGEPLLEYTDAPGGRISDERWRSPLRTSGLMWRRLRRDPSLVNGRAFVRQSAITAVVATQDALRRRGR